MPLKTILAYLPSIETAKPVLQVAVDLAEQHGGHLIGLHVVPQILHQRVPRYPVPSEMYTRLEDQLRDDAETIEQHFSKAAETLGNSEWQLQWAGDEEVVAHVVREAASADLVVTSQEIDYPFDGVPDSASRLVLNGSRPVLMVPREHSFQTIGESVAVGWKRGREAGRAIFDALPILQKAKSVYLVSVDERGDGEGAPAHLRAALARHGIDARDVVSKTPGAGEALLEQVGALGCDLLVMGCYGRPRLAELIFGGATRYVLRHMPVPVLMSH